MRRNANRRKPNRRKTKLGLPDLEHAKTAVLASLRSAESQRSYRHSIDEFVSWYCSEPRLAFNKTVVTRYRTHLEDLQLAPGTVNVRLAAVRRLAYEADTGLLSPELAAGIRRVKGSKKLGMRLGNWLTVTQARMLWKPPDVQTLKGKRDRAMLAVLLGCGLRRRELVQLSIVWCELRNPQFARVIPHRVPNDFVGHLSTPTGTSAFVDRQSPVHYNLRSFRRGTAVCHDFDRASVPGGRNGVRLKFSEDSCRAPGHPAWDLLMRSSRVGPDGSLGRVGQHL